MSANWRAVVRAAGFRISREDTIEISLQGGGKQTITLVAVDHETTLLASSVVAPARILNEVSEQESPFRYAWERNRLSDLLGFNVDRRGRLIGETWIPLQALEPDEFTIYVTELARVCDWHEFRLAGEDVY